MEDRGEGIEMEIGGGEIGSGAEFEAKVELGGVEKGANETV